MLWLFIKKNVDLCSGSVYRLFNFFYNVVIRWDVLIMRPSSVSYKATIGKQVKLLDVSLSKNVVIGDYTYINSGIVHSGVIGRFCSIGYNAMIGPS